MPSDATIFGEVLEDLPGCKGLLARFGFVGQFHSGARLFIHRGEQPFLEREYPCRSTFARLDPRLMVGVHVN